MLDRCSCGVFDVVRDRLGWTLPERLNDDVGATYWQSCDEKYRKNFGRERPDIRHVVVLMLENRTFDGCQGVHMNKRYNSGEVKRSKWDADGKDLFSYSNKATAPDGRVVDFPVWTVKENDDMMSEDNLSIPGGPAGPVEKFHFLNNCVYEVLRPTKDHIERGPTMGGFASEYYKKEIANPPLDGLALKPGIEATDFENGLSPVMYVYHPDQMTIFTQLMEKFGCSDTHFSSAPCQTWPNRLFAACGTCYGYYNNIPYVNPKGEDETEYYQSDDVHKMGAFEKMRSSYDKETVFERFDDKGVYWSIYHGQCSLAVLTTRLKYKPVSDSDNVHTLDELAEDVKKGTLANFVWLEPNYDPASEPTDMHPPANVLGGQKLISDVYRTLRSNEKVWKHTLFIVTCDEGVGSFDHVRPPAAVDPVVGHDHDYVHQKDGSPYEMSTNPFERFGTRVPNLLVSPWISPGAVVRPEGHDEEGRAPYPFDHTSIIRTAFDLLLGDPAEHLTERDKAAPSFAHALKTPGEELNMGPKEVICPDFDMKPLPMHQKHRCHGVPFLKAVCDVHAGRALQSTLASKLASALSM